MRELPPPIELMSRADVREEMERGDGVAVLDGSLGKVLFANASVRPLLGLAGPVAEASLILAPAMPTVRQVQSAARVLAERATATVLLRIATRSGSRTVPATLSRRADDPDTVLLTIAGLPRNAADDTRSLLAEAGLGERSGAVFVDGLMQAATPGFEAAALRDVEARAAAFAAGSQAFAVEDDGAAKVTFSRGPFSRILVLAQASERPVPPVETRSEPARVEAPVSEGSPSNEAPAPFSPGFSSFSVKRPKLGEGRGAMSVRALLQRWHLRGPIAPTPVPESSSVPLSNADEADPEPIVADVPARVVDAPERVEPAVHAAAEDDAPPAVTPALGEPATLPPADITALDRPMKPTPLRSAWGAPAPADEAEPHADVETTDKAVSAPEAEHDPAEAADATSPPITAETIEAPDASTTPEVATSVIDEDAGPSSVEQSVGEDDVVAEDAAAQDAPGTAVGLLDPSDDTDLVADESAPPEGSTSSDETRGTATDDEDLSAMAAIEAGSGRSVLAAMPEAGDGTAPPEAPTAASADDEAQTEASATMAAGEAAFVDEEAETPVEPLPAMAGDAEDVAIETRAGSGFDDAAVQSSETSATHSFSVEAAEPETPASLVDPSGVSAAADVAIAPSELETSEAPAGETNAVQDDVTAEEAGPASSTGSEAAPDLAATTPTDDVDSDVAETSDLAAPEAEMSAAIESPDEVLAEAADVEASPAVVGFDEPRETDVEPPHASEPAPVVDGAADEPSALASVPSEAGAAASAESGFEPRFDLAPVRFVWQIDREGAFRFLSPDFAAAVGPQAADVVGRGFSDVARVFGFDGTGEIARLLERRDTWSGRTILWPVQASSRKVPVDLAALPVYGRDRSFDGFRGFGVVRMNESVADEEGLGLLLSGDVSADSASGTDAGDETDAAIGGESRQDEDKAATPESPAAEGSKPIFRTFEADRANGTFGRRAAPPQVLPEPRDEAPAQKVIRLEERRRPRDGVLSQSEEAAFRAIGAKLGSPSEAKSPGALRFEDPASAPVEIEPADDRGDASSNEPLSDEVTSVDDARPFGETQVEEAQADVAPFEAPSDVLDRPDMREIGADETIDAAASASPSIAEDEIGNEDDAPLDITVFEGVFGSLPLAVLVQARERLVYANAEFARLTGHADAAGVEAAGGLDALIVDRGESGSVLIRRADGTGVNVRAHMQRIAEDGRSSLLMSFAPMAEEARQPVSPPAETETSTAIEDLRQEVEELQAVLDTATDGVVLLDVGGAIRAMNGSAHALFGLGPNEASGRNVSSLFAHESQKAMLDYLEMLRDDGMGGILNDGREVIGRVAQGGFIPLFVTIGRLSGDRGWCVVIRDIAHWKRIEEDLVNARRQAEAASLHKSRFLANISHELRTPLNAIIGFADVMASECFGPIGNERYLEYLGDIKRSGHHVLDLVNDLLDISKIEAGKLDLAFEAVSLNEIVSEVVSLMQPQANRERVIVRSNLPSSVPPVVADRRTIRQIALNLVANAIRFTPAGGQIIASTTYTAEGEVLLRFRDSGIGMTEREIEIALTPFQQVHAPSATRGEGTGLGLPLTKAMVEANRAQFAIHSTPGEGTLVEIAFPAPRVLAD